MNDILTILAGAIIKEILMQEYRNFIEAKAKKNKKRAKRSKKNNALNIRKIK